MMCGKVKYIRVKVVVPGRGVVICRIMHDMSRGPASHRSVSPHCALSATIQTQCYLVGAYPT